MTHKEKREIMKQAALDLEKGLSKEEVALKYGKSIDWVRLVAKEHNIDLIHKNRGRIKYNSLKIVKELYDSNKSMRKIGEENRVSEQRVQQIYEMARMIDIPGLPIRGRRG
jgi:hypothetical protein